jgi:hypothetical protein
LNGGTNEIPVIFLDGPEHYGPDVR